MLVSAVNLPPGSGTTALGDRKNLSGAMLAACRELQVRQAWLHGGSSIEGCKESMCSIPQVSWSTLMQGRHQALLGQMWMITAGTFNCKPARYEKRVYRGIAFHISQVEFDKHILVSTIHALI